MKCVKCGNELQEGAKFCTKCGTKIEFEAKPEQTKDAKKSGLGVIIAAVAVIVVLLLVIFALCMKIFLVDGKEERVKSENAVVEEQEDREEEEKKADKTEADNEAATEEATEQKEPSLYEKIPSGYTFCSGVGAWGTEIELQKDGTFTGSYHDSDAGSGGSGYDGTVYYCDFKGKFSEPVKVDAYTYRMHLDRLEITNETDEETIEDRVRYVPSDPYGFEDGEDFMIYLPGSEVASLPEAFVGWTLNVATGNTDATTLSFCGLFNVNAGYGFFSSPVEGFEEDSDYVISYSDSRLLTDADVEDLSLQEINYAKNEIYARHGYMFESNELQNYFGSKSWYDPRYKKAEFDKLGLLSDLENKNAAFLSSVEKSMGGYELDK